LRSSGEVSRPDIYVNQIKYLNTDTIRLIELKNDVEVDVDIELDSFQNFIKIQPQSIKCRANIKKLFSVDYKKIPIELIFSHQNKPQMGEKIITNELSYKEVVGEPCVGVCFVESCNVCSFSLVVFVECFEVSFEFFDAHAYIADFSI